MTILGDGFADLKSELAALDLNELRDEVEFQTDKELFSSLDELVEVFAPDRRVKRPRLV